MFARKRWRVAAVVGIVAGPIAWMLAADRYLDPYGPVLLAAIVTAPVGLWLRVRAKNAWAGRNAALASLGLWGGATALVCWLNVAADWHAPVEYRGRVVGNDAEVVSNKGGSVTRHYVLVDSWRRQAPERIRVDSMPPFVRRDFAPGDLLNPPAPATAWQLAVTTRSGALGLTHVVGVRYVEPEVVAAQEAAKVETELRAAIRKRLEARPDDRQAKRLAAALDGLKEFDPATREAAAGELRMYFQVGRTFADEGEKELAVLVGKLLASMPAVRR